MDRERYIEEQHNAERVHQERDETDGDVYRNREERAEFRDPKEDFSRASV